MKDHKKKIMIGQIGLGKWGKNLLRNFSSLPDCQVRYGCDLDQRNIDGLSRDYKGIRFISELDTVLKDEEIEGVVVATPAPAHYEIARKCLRSGKHVFVEKPITLDVAQAQELVKMANDNGKKIMVGHLLLYHPAIVKLSQIISEGQLGKIHYIYTKRLNLGTIRNTENVMWSLAPHDISIVLHLMRQSPVSVSALGASFVQKGIEDVAFLNLSFAGGEIGNVHVSWLDPTKTRRTIVVGSKKMAIFDEVSSRSTLILIDKGVDLNPDFKTYEEFLKLRFGEEQALSVSNEEPLKLECQHFIDCLRNGKEPISNGKNGLDVLEVLSAAERSLKNGGKNELL